MNAGLQRRGQRVPLAFPIAKPGAAGCALRCHDVEAWVIVQVGHENSRGVCAGHVLQRSGARPSSAASSAMSHSRPSNLSDGDARPRRRLQRHDVERAVVVDFGDRERGDLSHPTARLARWKLPDRSLVKTCSLPVASTRVASASPSPSTSPQAKARNPTTFLNGWMAAKVSAAGLFWVAGAAPPSLFWLASRLLRSSTSGGPLRLPSTMSRSPSDSMSAGHAPQ